MLKTHSHPDDFNLRVARLVELSLLSADPFRYDAEELTWRTRISAAARAELAEHGLDEEGRSASL